MPRLIALLILAPLLFAACRQHRQLGVSVDTATYLYQADPTIFHYRDTYYLYGTNDKHADSGFLVFSSKDLLHWRRKKTNNGFALLANEHTYGNNGFWAPQVFAYRHRLYMAYTANEHIAIAGSDSPQGLFSQPEVKPLEPEVKQIDPFVFFDTDGKIYLYHVRLQNGNRIFVEKLTENLLVKENTLAECLSAAENVQPWENTQPASWTVSEGPAVVKRGRLYYLFYSANDFRNPDYAMGYATAASPMGPWTKATGNPVISRQLLGINGTGHGDLLPTGNGKLFYVFHTHFSNTKVGWRKTALIELVFAADGSVSADPKTFRYLQESE